MSCRSCVSSHSCCEVVSTAIMSCQKKQFHSIPPQLLALFTPSSDILSEPWGGKWVVYGFALSTPENIILYALTSCEFLY